MLALEFFKQRMTGSLLLMELQHLIELLLVPLPVTPVELGARRLVGILSNFFLHN